MNDPLKVRAADGNYVLDGDDVVTDTTGDNDRCNAIAAMHGMNYVKILRRALETLPAVFTFRQFATACESISNEEGF